MEFVPLLPAASVAVTVKVCVPLETVPEFHVLLKGELILVVDAAPPSTLRLTDFTPTLSEAFTKTSKTPETDAPLAGEVILIVGAIASLFPPFTMPPIDLREKGSCI